MHEGGPIFTKTQRPSVLFRPAGPGPIHDHRHTEAMAQELFKQKEKTQVRTAGKELVRQVSDACPYCGKIIKGTEEFCPHCGCPLAPYCTFCGAEVPPGEESCPECGMSRAGVACPRCGTINARAYCRNCNEPLTPAARKEVERAKKDPVYLKAAELAVRMAELQQLMDDTPEGGLIDVGGDGSESPKPARELPPDILRLKEMLASVQSGGPAPARPDPAPKQQAAPAKTRSKRKSKAELQAEYEKMKAELNSTLEHMVPPAGSTPQEQRNYYSARRISVIQKVKSNNPVAWVCNYCGCWHNKPSECCEPWHGGTWIYEDKTITVTKEL